MSTSLPSVLAGEELAEARSTALRAESRGQQQRQTTRRPRPQSNVTQELRRVNGRVAALKSDNDSLKAKVAVLERSIKGLTEALPALRSSLESTVKAKSAMDSSELAFVNQMSLLMNKIRLLEDKAAYIDSTNFEILSQLVLIENKIVSLTSSFNDIMAARQREATPSPEAVSDEDFRRRYIEALTSYQNGQYAESADRFAGLIRLGMQHELADNSQYWLAECFYALKNYKRAISEFERVFGFSGSDKGDDARYKIALSYWNVGSEDRARIEFRKLLDDYPDSELDERARRYLQSP
ncbi:MAG: tetratricopeptide repeat protein [Candidatus Neomarinimicrobiota bacterium]